jgi:glycosyltransferase involved in cell wall biosynthesis
MRTKFLSSPPEMPMQIAIDAHQLGLRRTGTETYVHNLVKHLAVLEPNGERYLVYLDRRHQPNGWSHGLNFETRTVPTSNSHLRFGIFYPLESWRRSIDVFHSQFSVPPFLRTRSVLTVYDLAFERFPQFFRPWERRQMAFLVRWSCGRADHIITISESSKRDLVEFYRVDPNRVTVTYPGAGETYQPREKESAKTRLAEIYGITTPYILYVGNIEPRKNLSRLLEAFAELKGKDRVPHKLVIVGQKAWLYDGIFATVRKHSLETEVVLTGYVPTEDLPAFYNAATALVYPSLFEGFGLPVVEAMACGTPVITSFGSSLEEIATGAAILVDPLSVASIAAAIETVANGEDVQRKLRQAGLTRAAQFSFRKMAEQTREVYRRVGGH